MELNEVQYALRLLVGVLSFVAFILSARSVLDAARGSHAPRTGLGVGVNLVFFGQFWFQLGYVLSGVPDVFHGWNVTALAALAVGSATFIFGWSLDRIERRARHNAG